ncbi:MAG TPA: hypothetical protein P5228_01885 [Bacteroidales bacterium]|nr:hypothetical protein [Bacteroidales bacterium]HRZ50117.1 hypothetical protein [Bacteroidales bacterium]
MTHHRYADELDHLTRKIIDRIGSITRYSGRIPAIELDLALEEIRRLYDLCSLIRSLEASVPYGPADEPVQQAVDTAADAFTANEVQQPVSAQPQPEPVTSQEEMVQPEPVPEVIQPEPVPEIIQPEPVPVQPEPEAVRPKPVAAETSAGVQPAASVVKPSAAPKVAEQKEKETSRGDGKKILGEALIKGGAQSINDLIAARFSDQSISGRMQHNPISNLKTAIGINEKFIFVYELFMGNMALYNEVIEQLNTMPGRNEAIALMEELRSQYHWDIENMAFQKLIDIVTRRYS